ncbi:hypothetical protein [Aureispira sp. CCB-E]|uniref:hypothetical protein n=1 Tax=Aureispira sp. CCB-E TaxID=3051121 RepID=UPI002868C394|nr:hypothetical protein [Aureispira sp. CCB-E]WMX15296.1 hypothetical protein QP953_02785 [Aureispira sp. CCB-E]
MNLAALKIAVGVPYFSIWMLLLIPTLYGIYSIWKYVKWRSKLNLLKEEARKETQSKLKNFATTAQPLDINDYGHFMDAALEDATEQPKEPKKSIYKRRKKKKLNKRNNRRRSTKKSRKNNRK